MALLNEHFLKLKGSYLFSDIAKKVKAYQVTHPGEQIIRLGIGDVTRPLPQASIEAMHRAVDEMASSATTAPWTKWHHPRPSTATVPSRDTIS